MRVSEYFSGFSRNLLAKSEFNGYSIYHEIKTQLREECSSDVGFWMRNFHQHYCARRTPPGYLRSNHHFPPGRLTVDRAPNFGWNLGFNLQIDGRPVGSIAQGHSYSTWLSAGPHVLTVLKVPAVGLYRANFDNSQHSARRGPSVHCHVGFRSGLSPTGRSLVDARGILAKSR